MGEGGGFNEESDFTGGITFERGDCHGSSVGVGGGGRGEELVEIRGGGRLSCRPWRGGRRKCQGRRDGQRGNDGS